jgi:hypothetical protein
MVEQPALHLRFKHFQLFLGWFLLGHWWYVADSHRPMFKDRGKSIHLRSKVRSVSSYISAELLWTTQILIKFVP